MNQRRTAAMQRRICQNDVNTVCATIFGRVQPVLRPRCLANAHDVLTLAG